MNKNVLGITKKAENFLEAVSRLIDKQLQVEETRKTSEILEYPISTKGQMIRPFLCYVTARAVNPEISTEDLSRLQCFAAAVELLHNASLIHDDVLDNEMERRGKKSLYRAYGIKNAILAGNIYYIKAVELVVKNIGSFYCSLLMETAEAMCFGEMLQQQFDGTELPEDVYLRVISQKTASLIGLACMGGAAVAGADEDTMKGFRKLGEHMGYIYQLQDDLNDNDTNIENGFDFKQQLLEYSRQIDSFIDTLPHSEYSAAFLEFSKVLLKKIK